MRAPHSQRLLLPGSKRRRRSNRNRVIAATTAFVFSLVGVAMSGPTASAATVDVTMQNLQYVPNEVSIAEGDTVVWTAADAESHSADWLGDDRLPALPSGRGSQLWVAWRRPRVSLGETHLLCAVSRRGELSFTASLTPFDGARVRAFADQLRTVFCRRATLVVCDWPLGHLDTLTSWQLDDPDVLIRG